MTARKADLPLPPRTPAYVSREVGAAELCICPNTWDTMVREQQLPPPTTYVRGNPRWKWSIVEKWLAGDKPLVQDAFTLAERVRESSRREAEAGR